VTGTSGESRTQARYSLLDLAATLPDVISLGRGDPDLATPQPILDAALESMRRPAAPAPVRGLPELRQALAERYRREKGLEFDPDREILITNGAQEGLFLSMLTLVDPGDGVLMADPRYSSYDQAVAAAGGRIVEVATGKGDDFTLDPDALDGLLRRTERAKVLVLVNPSNPTGALTPPARVRRIAEVARAAGLAVVSDEIYENLVFDGARLLSVAACDDMREWTVTLSGFSKTYAMTGFRVGYLLGPPGFVEAATRLKAAVSGPSPLFSQLAASAALAQPPETIEALRLTFERRRDVMTRGLDDLDIPYGHPGGAFFVWADVSRFGLPAEQFCRKLLVDARVLVFPGSSFGERWSGFVRISLLQPEEKLREVLGRIRSFVESIEKEQAE
jgi:aminotransferase